MTSAWRATLSGVGLNALGVLSRARFDARVPPAWRADALLPAARVAVVVGSGGRAFGDAYLASSEAGDVAPDPVDRFTARALEAAVAELRAGAHAARALFYWERHGDAFADFVALGEACGLGVPSRLGLLLHPVFGPWLALRGVLLTDAQLPETAPLAGFAPCDGCPAPCTGACPGDAPGRDGFDVAACLATTRTRAACRAHCDARRACPVGTDHAYAPALETIHRAAAVRAASYS